MLDKEKLLRNKEQLILKALDSTAGAALIPQYLSPVISELVFKLNPLIGMMSSRGIDTNRFDFAQRTSLPTNSSIVGEKSTTISGNSSYNPASIYTKPMRQKGGVTGYQQAGSRGFIDSYKTEVIGSAEKLGYDIENQLLWGNSVDTYQFSGIEALLPLSSKFDGIGVVTLDDLDLINDYTIDNGSRGHKKIYVMSVRMRSKVSSLQTQIQMPIREVDVKGGFKFQSYQTIPIVESSFCAANGLMGVVTPSLIAGGTLTDATTYYYRVSAIRSTGETVACAEVSQLTASPSLTIRLSWTAVPDAILYQIFRATTTGQTTLLTTIPARTYDSSGNVTGSVTQIDDDGSYTEDGQTKPLDANEESIYLIDLDPDKGSELPYSNINPTLKNFITFEELSKIDDVQEYLVKSYLALALKNGYNSARLRNVKTA